jgi:GntR family uxuAB operon transcriptional repressor
MVGDERSAADQRAVTPLGSVVRTTLAEQVREQLIAYINDNLLKPGDRLPSEGQLVARFGVSRPVVREALRGLQGQQVIRIIAGKGAVINDPEASMLTPYFRQVISADVEPRELLAARAPIEIAAAELAADNRTEPQLEGLRELLGVMARSHNDAQAYASADADFHVKLAEASGNTILAHFVESMHDALRVVAIKGLSRRSTATELRVVQDLHSSILRSVADRDAAATRVAMQEHFDEAFGYLTNNASSIPPSTQG